MPVHAPVAEATLAFCWPCLHRAMCEAQGVLPMRVGGMTSQLHLPSLMPLIVAGFGRLQLGVPPLGYFKVFLQVVDN